MQSSDAALFDSLAGQLLQRTPITEMVRRQGDSFKAGKNASGFSTFDVKSASGKEETGTAFKAKTADGKVVPIIMRGEAGKGGTAEVVVPGGKRVSLSIAQASKLRQNISMYDMADVPRLIASIRADRKLPEGIDAIALDTLLEKSPPGWSGTVKAMKKHMPDDKAFALAWSMHKKGAKPHYKPEEGGSTSEGEPRKKKKYQDEAADWRDDIGKFTKMELRVLSYMRKRDKDLSGVLITPSVASDDLFGDERRAENDDQVRQAMFTLRTKGKLKMIKKGKQQVYKLSEALERGLVEADGDQEDDLTFIADPAEMQRSIEQKLGLASMRSADDVLDIIASMYDEEDVPAAVYAAAAGMARAEQNVSASAAKALNQLKPADVAAALIRSVKATGSASIKDAERWWTTEIGKFDSDRGTPAANNVTISNSDEVQPYIDSLSTEDVDSAFDASIDEMPIGYGALSCYDIIGIESGYRVPEEMRDSDDRSTERAVDRVAAIGSIRDGVARDMQTAQVDRSSPNLPGVENRIKPMQYTAESIDRLDFNTRLRMAEAYDRLMGNAPDMSQDELVDAEAYRAMMIAQHSDPMGVTTPIAAFDSIGKVEVNAVDDAFDDAVDDDDEE